MRHDRTAHFHAAHGVHIYRNLSRIRHFANGSRFGDIQQFEVVETVPVVVPILGLVQTDPQIPFRQ